MSAGLTTVEQTKWWEPIANGFRWVAFIPGGLLGGMLASALAMILFAFKIWFHDEGAIEFLGQFFAAGVFGYVSVQCAVYIAPIPNKTIPAIAMAVVMLLLYGALIFVCAVERSWVDLVKCIVTVAAVAFAMYHHIASKG